MGIGGRNATQPQCVILVGALNVNFNAGQIDDQRLGIVVPAVLQTHGNLIAVTSRKVGGPVGRRTLVLAGIRRFTNHGQYGSTVLCGERQGVGTVISN